MTPISPIPPMCTATALDRSGRPRRCIEDQGHGGDHVDVRGFHWEPLEDALRRLQARWGRTHRVVCTGRMWIATAHQDDASHLSEIQPTPEQLDQILILHGFTPAPQEQR